VTGDSRLGDFTDQVGAYAARPGYPPALVDALVAHVGVRAGDAVADLGAGTGIFTRHLAARGFAVTAVEPNAAMRAAAPELSGVRWQSGTGERTGLASASQRWLVAAQSFHWIDAERGLAEARRVLAPGGHFTVLWNDRDNPRSEILTETMAVLHRVVPEYDHGYRARPWVEVLCSTGDFRVVVAHEVRHDVRMARDQYLALWRSNNHICTIAGERLERLLREVAEVVDRRGAGAVDIPYVCRAWTAVTANGRAG